jgi:phospholipase C
MRRRIAAAAVACAVLAGIMMVPVISGAQATSPIKHVVFIFLENDSFDHILGFWCNDHPARCPDGGMPSRVKLSDGSVVTPWVPGFKNPAVEHNVTATLAAMNGGKMDGWQNIKGPQGDCSASLHYPCITGYTSAQLPNITNLANNFAISDKTFTLSDSASWAGHMVAVSASLDGFYGNNPHRPGGVPKKPGWGCDSNNLAPWGPNLTYVPSCIPDPALNPANHPNGGAYKATPVRHIPTIMDRLHVAGLSWKIYGAADKTEHDYGMWDICPTFADCLYTSQDKHLVPDAQFITDASSGHLPTFSVVTPGGPNFLNACHNGMGMVACDNWVGRLAKTIMNGPEWSSTAVFISFDDFGGFYDQVPPGTAPDGTQEGPRVPMIILSPFAKPGYTDTTSATFAGVLAFTEQTFGLTPLGVNDKGAYGFTNAFNFNQAPRGPVRMVSRPLPPAERHIKLTPLLENDPT